MKAYWAEKVVRLVVVLLLYVERWVKIEDISRCVVRVYFCIIRK